MNTDTVIWRLRLVTGKEDAAYGLAFTGLSFWDNGCGRTSAFEGPPKAGEQRLCGLPVLQ